MEIQVDLPKHESIKSNKQNRSNMDARLTNLLCMLTETTQSCIQLLNEQSRSQEEEKEKIAGKKSSTANQHFAWDIGMSLTSGALAFTPGGQTAAHAASNITSGGDSVFNTWSGKHQDASQKLEKKTDKSSDLKRSLQDTNRQLNQATEKIMEEEKRTYQKGIQG